jgi:murein DD-endopeptidase MepM/ murein hydrolase activator NlpD
MSVMSVRFALLVPALAAAMLLLPDSARAAHDDYRFKWPYAPGVSHPTTRHPFENGHGDAWDVVIGGNGVVASAEGTVVAATSQYDPNSCDAEDGGGFGNYVQVRTSTPQGDKTVTYAHLTSTGAALNARVLQGDAIGVQGKTGHTRGVEPPNNCGTHLHFQFNPAHPAVIDGQAVSNGSDAGESTNAPVGNFTQAGLAIRQHYYDLGGVFTSWAYVGRAADASGGQSGCPASASFGRLFVHPIPDPAEGHWGAEQTFCRNPDSLGFTCGAVQSGRWAPNAAYWIQPSFYFAWLLKGQLEDVATRFSLGVPLMGQIGPIPTLCDAVDGCVAYQRFHQGYVWSTGGAMLEARYCPDVSPAYPWPDYAVSSSDIFALVARFGRTDAASGPYDPWPESWYDLNGNGAIDNGDIFQAVLAFGTTCHP